MPGTGDPAGFYRMFSFLYTPYRCPLKMPIERVDFIDTLLFHNDHGKGIIDADRIFLCPHLSEVANVLEDAAGIGFACDLLSAVMAKPSN